METVEHTCIIKMWGLWERKIWIIPSIKRNGSFFSIKALLGNGSKQFKMYELLFHF